MKLLSNQNDFYGRFCYISKFVTAINFHMKYVLSCFLLFRINAKMNVAIMISQYKHFPIVISFQPITQAILSVDHKNSIVGFSLAKAGRQESTLRNKNGDYLDFRTV